MSYKMEYGLGTPVIRTTKRIQKKKIMSPQKWLILSLLAAFIGVCIFTDILIPGDAEVTKAAMSEFVSDIKGGGQVVDAFAAFCQTVLQGS